MSRARCSQTVLHGEAGADTLSGDAAADVLEGQAGNDTLYGGAGDDRFVYSATASLDLNIDTVYGDDDSDTLDFTGIEASAGVHINLGSSGTQGVVVASSTTFLGLVM